MTRKIAARMDRMAPSGIRKVNEKALAMERAGEKIIHFEIGRPDFDTPDYIKKAAIESLNAGNVFYTSNFGTMELREENANNLKRENNIDYKPTEELVTAGISESVFSQRVSMRATSCSSPIPSGSTTSTFRVFSTPFR